MVRDYKKSLQNNKVSHLESLHALPAIQWWKAAPCSHGFDSCLCTQVSTLVPYRTYISMELDTTTYRITAGKLKNHEKKWQILLKCLLFTQNIKF